MLERARKSIHGAYVVKDINSDMPNTSMFWVLLPGETTDVSTEEEG